MATQTHGMNKEIIFKDRSEAGAQLAFKLLPYEKERPLVLALPRGGVPVGYEVAKTLHAPLDTVVVRKIGLPYSPEYGVGAIAPGDVLVLNDKLIESLGLDKDDIDPIIQHEMEEMERRIAHYKSGVYSSDVVADTMILIDDGLATGLTARAAVESVKMMLKPKKIIFGSPVCSHDTASDISSIVDDFVCVSLVEDLVAVGRWYEEFDQVTDAEVIEYLEKANGDQRMQ